jgi:hypothetical protein
VTQPFGGNEEAEFNRRLQEAVASGQKKLDMFGLAPSLRVPVSLLYFPNGLRPWEQGMTFAALMDKVCSMMLV